MKRYSPLLAVFVLSLLLFQCASNKNKSDNGHMIDTLFVHDTIMIGEQQVALHATKMNVLYTGVENPLDLEVIGLNPEDIRVSISGGGGSIKKISDTQYMVTVSQPGDTRINISADGFTKTFEFRVKRLPDPVVRLGNTSGGEIGIGEFKAQAGLNAFLDNFDFDVRAEVVGFNLIQIARRQDPVEATNSGARFNDRAKMLIQNAKPGDVYLFTNVKVRLPGDAASRTVNSLAFKIK